jgi:hypothetical protein
MKSTKNVKKCYFLFLVVFCLAPFFSYSQTDSTFWFAAPELQQNHGDRPILLRLSSTGPSAVVNISIPADPNFVPIQVNLAANTSQSVDLTPFINSIENDLPNTVLNKGILIKSNSLISCYYDIANGLNGDIFSLKGYNGLGFKFMVPSQKAFSSYAYSGGYYCDVIICATENNTSIKITPTTTLQGHAANSTFTIILQKGQTYVCRSDNGNPSDRPGGMSIVSNRPIAVTLKDDSVQYPGYGCADTAGDQLIPDNNTGTDFVIVKGYLYQPDNFYVFAINNNTTVSVDSYFKYGRILSRNFKYKCFICSNIIRCTYISNIRIWM